MRVRAIEQLRYSKRVGKGMGIENVSERWSVREIGIEEVRE